MSKSEIIKDLRDFNEARINLGTAKDKEAKLFAKLRAKYIGEESIVGNRDSLLSSMKEELANVVYEEES